MRPYRKVYNQLLRSDKLSRVSYEARWLYTLLLVAQDDEGRFPWTASQVKSLTATTDWEFKGATGHRDELVKTGAIETDGKVITIVRGKELNGNPRPTQYPDFHYPDIVPNSTEGTPKVPSRNLECNPDKIREDKIREDKIREDKIREDKIREGDGPSGLLQAFSEEERQALSQTFPGYDLSYEAQKCLDWWSEGGRKMKRPKSAFRNWLEKAKEISNDRKPGGHTQDDIPEGYEQPRYSRSFSGRP